MDDPKKLSRRRFVAAAAFGSALASRSSFAQGANQFTLSGIVDGVLGDTVYVTDGGIRWSIGLALGGIAWKRVWRRDVADLRTGDEIVARGYLEGNRLSATALWANATSFSGAITATTPSGYTVLTRRLQTRNVLVDSDTVDARSLPLTLGDVQVGRDVETIGVKVSDGTVRATRVTVYVNNRQTTMAPDALIMNPRTGLPFRP
jgi:hypothetical protein